MRMRRCFSHADEEVHFSWACLSHAVHAAAAAAAAVAHQQWALPATTEPRASQVGHVAHRLHIAASTCAMQKRKAEANSGQEAHSTH
jgi:hypothetical protein